MTGTVWWPSTTTPNSTALPANDQPGRVALRYAAYPVGCGQALQEGGQGDSGYMEDADGGREQVPLAAGAGADG